MDEKEEEFIPVYTKGKREVGVLGQLAKNESRTVCNTFSDLFQRYRHAVVGIPVVINMSKREIIT